MRDSGADRGDLAIVLHSHMPYVEGFGTYPFGEEWLFDAIVRSYLPVLDVAERVTVTVTPVLADQLEAPGVADRFRAFASEFRVATCEAEGPQMAETEAEPAFAAACESEAARYRESLRRLSGLGDDLIEVFAGPAREGRVELVPSSATHAVMPLVATVPGRRLQIDAGLRSHRRRFGPARGFWLPECAYEPGIERLLAERGLEWFVSDQSAHEPAPESLAPATARNAMTAFTIDWEAVSWLWSLEGYPSDPVHRDFHRQSLRGVRPWAISGDPYDPGAASAAARRQAGELLDGVAARLERFRGATGERGLVVFAVDMELLGHWWWEGPEWLRAVLEGAADRGVGLITLSEALDSHPPTERPLRASTWGEAQGPAHVGGLAGGRPRSRRAAAGAAGAARPGRRALRRGRRASGT